MNSNWNIIKTKQGVDEIIQESLERPVAIFKHSTRCGISHHAMHNIESDWEIFHDQYKMYYLSLLDYREISNYIAEKLNVVHQSPQLIMMNNKEIVKVLTHSEIAVKNI